MIKVGRRRRLLHVACLLPLVVLAACSYSLQDRIRDVQADFEDTPVIEPPARSQTRVRGGGPRVRRADPLEDPISRSRPSDDLRASYMNADAVGERANDSDALAPRAPAPTRNRDASVGSDAPDTAAGRISRWQAVPPNHKRTPEVDTPEWIKEQAEAAEKDRRLDRKIRSICRAC